MLHRTILGLSVLCLCYQSALLAQDGARPSTTEVLVTANRIEQPRSQVASSVTVIDQEEIASRAETSVADLLRGSEGVDVVRSGPAGGNTSVFLRGANPEHTLVIVDGVEVNNPVNPTRSYNFANLDLNNIERIEIMRGPQSVLYGSDALGGVIVITTKKGAGKTSYNFSSEAGSYQTFNENVSVAGSEQILSYSLAAQRQDSAGISAARASDGNSEHDAYHNTSLSSRFGLDPNENIGADLIMRYIDSRAELDNSGGVGGDDPNRDFSDEEFFLRAQGRTKLFDSKLRQVFGISFNDQGYHDDNDPDADHPIDLLRSHYDGSSIKFDLNNEYVANEALTLSLGLETEEERASSAFFSDGEFGPFSSNFDQQDARSNAYFTQAQLNLDDTLFSSFGIRLDDHENFGNKVTWRIAPVLKLNQGNTRVFSTVGTAYKAPSLYQLYSEYGREDLEPEESLGVDAGIEQKFLNQSVGITATWFKNNFDNLISFDPATFIFENIADAETHGAEIELAVSPSESLRLASAITLMRTEDKNSGERLLRRPNTKVSGRVRYQACERLNLALDLIYTGQRDDNDFTTFPAQRSELSGYTLLNFGANYKLNDSLELFTRVENIFDTEYEEVLGYGTLGTSAFAGIKLNM